ncbi:MAG: helix-turn-helix domain-containing protein [Blastomonas sp.]
MTRPTFTVRSLADRWECSEGMIRKMIKTGDLQCFTIGSLIRVPATEVERIECASPNTPSSDSEADTPSSGPTPMESPIGTVLPPPIGLTPKRKLASAGGAATVHHGPWSA